MHRVVKTAVRSQGASLGGTLLAISVLALLAFSLSSLMVTHLRMSSQQDRSLLASNAARSTVSAAIAKIMENSKFGQTGALEQEVRLELPEAVGILTFNQDSAQKNGLPYSTNNLDGREDAPGAEGALVPASTVYLTAVGRSGGVERRVDVVLRVPPFPWAIASGGRIDTRNGVYVASLPEGVWPPPTDESELLPADLVANGIGSKAISLGDQSTILGDVEAVGSVYIQSPSKVVVKGEVLSGSSPVEIPVIHPADFDPISKNIDHFELTAGNVEELTGTARAGVPLEFVRPLKLDNAQLYVDGDLTLRGGVTGTGALIATGNVTVLGGARVEAPTELAVISGGQVRLAGEGPERSRIRGLFYADKGLEASEMTLVGSLLTGNASTGIALDEVNVFHEQPRDVGVKKSTASGNVVYFGKYEPGGRATLDTASISTTKPDYKYGFSIRIERVNPQTLRPLRVTVGPGFVTSQTRAWTIQRDAEFGNVYNWLSSEIRRGVSVPLSPPSDLTKLYANGVAPLVDRIDANNVSEEPGGDNESGVSLIGNEFSQFFPIEDRIRLISWIER